MDSIDKGISLRRLLLESCAEFSQDHAPRLGAALAYYTVFSIAPLLIIVMSVAGLIFGADAVRGELFSQISGLVGPDGAKFIQDAIASAESQKKSAMATIVGVIILFFGATGVFIQLQDALNTVWEVTPIRKGWFAEVLARWTSFTMVVGIGFLLLVSLIFSTLAALLTKMLPSFSAGGALLMEGVNLVGSFAMITLLFALMYRVLPGVRLRWRDVWFGAALTSLLFVVGKTLLGIYLGRAAIASGYGAAGTVVVVLVWVYYSAQILLFGAECTQVLARMRGRNVTLRAGYELAKKDAWQIAEV